MVLEFGYSGCSMPETLPLDQLKDFIKTVPPFHLLSGSALDELVRTLVIEYFPKGEIILSPEGPPTQFLYIIRTGGVRFLLKDREKGGRRRSMTTGMKEIFLASFHS